MTDEWIVHQRMAMRVRAAERQVGKAFAAGAVTSAVITAALLALLIFGG